MQIYKITNQINSKAYIGQTRKGVEKRWAYHWKQRNELKDHFHYALAKYTKEAWKIEVIEEVEDIDLLNEREIYWIDHFDTFNNGYNSRSGGGQHTILSEEVRQKLSTAHKGMKYSEEHKHNLSIAHKGHIHSEEHKKKISNALLGKTHTEESKEKMRGRVLSKETKQKIGSYHKNKIVSEETRKKQSASQKKRFNNG